MRRDWQVAALVSGVLHAGVLFAGLDALDSQPRALGAGMGPRGEFQVIALTPDQAARLLARRGPARVPLLVEAGGRGRPSPVEELPLAAPRPIGPEGAGVGGGPTLAELGAGRGGSAASAPARGAGALGAPEALPAAPSPVAGAPNDPSVAAAETAPDESEGPDAAGVDELAGSEGQSADDAGAADGDRAIGLDAATIDNFVIRSVAPVHPPELKARQIGGEAVFLFSVDERGRVRIDRMVSGTGNRILDRKAREALLHHRYDGAAIAARGWVGRLWRIRFRYVL